MRWGKAGKEKFVCPGVCSYVILIYIFMCENHKSGVVVVFSS